MATQVAPAVYANPNAPTVEELKARIAQLERRDANEGNVVKYTEKGSLSMYGLGKFPVTLTITQWLKLAVQLPKLLAFAAANFSKLFFHTEEQRKAAQAALKLS